MHELDDITGAIVDSAVRIHKELGPGLLESFTRWCCRESSSGEDSKCSGKEEFASNTTA